MEIVDFDRLKPGVKLSWDVDDQHETSKGRLYLSLSDTLKCHQVLKCAFLKNMLFQVDISDRKFMSNVSTPH